MNSRLKRLLVTLSVIVFSCEVKPGKIQYGMDACDFCQMTVIDKQHAAQLVTEKGKVYKYDAIECMMHALKEWDRPSVAIYLVTDYANPGELTNALDASYLISEEIPSPMGANLTAFAEESARREIHQNNGGTTLQWAELMNYFELNRLAGR